jgi:hypothetical protein
MGTILLLPARRCHAKLGVAPENPAGKGIPGKMNLQANVAYVSRIGSAMVSDAG